MPDYRIAVVVDPSGAQAGAAATSTALKGVQSEAVKTKDTLAQLASGQSLRAFDQAVATIDKTKQALSDEIRILQADATQREKLSAVLQLEAKLRGTGVELMAEERAAVEGLIATKAALAAEEKEWSDALAAAEAKVNVELAEQKTVFERIRGPMLQYQEDIRALNALLAKGAITQAEYNAEQLRSAETARAAAAAQKGEGIGSEVAGAAGVGGLGLVAGGALAGGAIISLTGDYQNLQNKLRQVTQSSGELATVQKHLFDLSDETGASVDSLATIYQRTINATQHLGISSQDTSHFVDELAKIVSYSGVSSTEAAQGLIQLSQGMGRGVLQGQDLKAVLEDVPEIGRRIADGLGVSTSQLREMGTEGKLTTQQLIDGLNKSSDAIDQNFNKRVPTADQAMNQLHNSAEKLASTIGEKLVPALQHLADGVKALDDLKVPDALGAIIQSGIGNTASDTLGQVGDALKSPTFGALGQSALLKTQYLNQYNALAAQSGGVDTQLEDLDKKIASIDKHQASHLAELKQEGHAAAEAAKEHADALKKVTDELFPLEKAQREQATAASDLFELMKKGTLTYDQAAAALQRWTKAHQDVLDPIGAEVAKIQEQTKAVLAVTQAQKDQLAAETAVNAAIDAGSLTLDQKTGAIARYLDALKEQHRAEAFVAAGQGLGAVKGPGLFSGELALGSQAEDAVSRLNAREAQKKLASDATANAKLIADIYKSAFTLVDHTILDTVEKGKFNFHDFAQSAIQALDQIAIKALELAVLKDIFHLPETSKGGLSLSTFGFATGGSIYPDGSVHRAATGYSEMVRGAGGTDSQYRGFWVTPGERVDVLTPQQQAAQAQAYAAARSGGQGSGASNVNVTPHVEVRFGDDAIHDSIRKPSGVRALVDIVRANSAAFNGALRR